MYYLQRNELRKFIIPIDNHDASAKVSNLGNLTNVVKLIRKLGKIGINMFKKTCFGHILKMNLIKFYGGFVHYNLKIVTIDVCGMVHNVL